LHDINNLDKLGIPGMVVATTEFKVAAASQAKTLGIDPEIVWVEHPIQSMTAQELEAVADKAFTPVMETLTKN
jgi:hypothetical protein